jgi:hypothetical protein
VISSWMWRRHLVLGWFLDPGFARGLESVDWEALDPDLLTFSNDEFALKYLKLPYWKARRWLS